MLNMKVSYFENVTQAVNHDKEKENLTFNIMFTFWK